MVSLWNLLQALPQLYFISVKDTMTKRIAGHKKVHLGSFLFHYEICFVLFHYEIYFTAAFYILQCERCDSIWKHFEWVIAWEMSPPFSSFKQQIRNVPLISQVEYLVLADNIAPVPFEELEYQWHITVLNTFLTTHYNFTSITWAS